MTTATAMPLPDMVSAGDARPGTEPRAYGGFRPAEPDTRGEPAP